MRSAVSPKIRSKRASERASGNRGRPLNYKFLLVNAKNVIILWASRNCDRNCDAVVNEIVRRVGLPWVRTLSNYSELWRQKAEAWIESKMKEEDFDPAATRAAHEALLKELEETTDPQTKAAWERLMGVIKK